MTIIGLSISLLLGVGLLAVSVLAGQYAPPVILIVLTGLWAFGVIRTWLKYQGTRVFVSGGFGVILIALMWIIHHLRGG